MTMYIEDVKDYSDNVIKEKEIKVKPIVDQTRPVVRNVSVDEDGKVITVKFSKNIHQDSLKDKYFVIKDKDAKVRGISKIEHGTDNNIVQITLIEKLPAGKNTIKIDGVKDATHLQNVMLPYEKEIDTKNTDKPTCTGIATSNDKKTIILSFDKRMDASTLAKASNYSITFDKSTRGLPSDTEIDVIENGKAVRIILPQKISGKDVVFGDNLTLIEFFGLRDIDGNELKGYKSEKEIKNDDLSKAKLAVYDDEVSKTANGEAKDRNTIKVKFNQSIGRVSASDFVIKDKNDKELNIIKKVSFEGSVVTITTDEKLPTDIKEITLSVKSGNSIETAAGLKVATPGDAELIDKISPEVVADKKEYEVTGNVIKIPFTEKLRKDASLVGLYAEDLKVVQIGESEKVLKGGVGYTTALSTDQKSIEITILATGDHRYKVELKDSGNGKANYIQDESKNLALAKEMLYTDSKINVLTDAQKDLAAAEKAVTDAEKALGEAKTEAAAANTALETAKETAKVEIPKAEKAVADAQKALDDETDDSKKPALQQAVADAENKLEAAKKIVTDAEKAKTDADAKVTAAEKTLEEAKKALEDLKNK